MRALHQIALVAAIMAIPSAGYSQDRGLVDGKVGADSIVLDGATRLVRSA